MKAFKYQEVQKTKFKKSKYVTIYYKSSDLRHYIIFFFCSRYNGEMIELGENIDALANALWENVSLFTSEYFHLKKSPDDCFCWRMQIKIISNHLLKLVLNNDY